MLNDKIDFIITIYLFYTILYYIIDTLIMATQHDLGQYFTTNAELKEKVYEFIQNSPSVILEPSVDAAIWFPLLRVKCRACVRYARDRHENKVAGRNSTTPTPSMVILWKTRPQRQRHTPRSWVIRRSLGLNGAIYIDFTENAITCSTTTANSCSRSVGFP
jgi:hypothetical protein